MDYLIYSMDFSSEFGTETPLVTMMIYTGKQTGNNYLIDSPILVISFQYLLTMASSRITFLDWKLRTLCTLDWPLTGGWILEDSAGRMWLFTIITVLWDGISLRWSPQLVQD